MTKYNDAHPDDPVAATIAAAEDLVTQLAVDEEARAEAVRIVRETAREGGPGIHHRYADGFALSAQNHRAHEELAPS